MKRLLLAILFVTGILLVGSESIYFPELNCLGLGAFGLFALASQKLEDEN